jgi:hypothetical protein
VSFAPSRKTWGRQATFLLEGDTEGFEAYTKQLVAGREPDPLQALVPQTCSSLNGINISPQANAGMHAASRFSLVLL